MRFFFFSKVCFISSFANTFIFCFIIFCFNFLNFIIVFSIFVAFFLIFVVFLIQFKSLNVFENIFILFVQINHFDFIVNVSKRVIREIDKLFFKHDKI